MANLNADMVNGFEADATPVKNKLLPLGSSGQFARGAIPKESPRITSLFQNQRGPLPLGRNVHDLGKETSSSPPPVPAIDETNGGTIGMRVNIDGATLEVARTYYERGAGSHRGVHADLSSARTRIGTTHSLFP